jgi:hypothetical protein
MIRLVCGFLLLAALFYGPSLQALTSVNVLDTKTLGQLESTGYSLNEALGLNGSVSQASELYKSNSFYKSVADTVGLHLDHDPKTDQLPAVIPALSGDIPTMVQSLRGFEDKGRRSEQDLKGGFIIRHLSNNSQYPYMVEHDGDEPRHFDERWLWSPFAFFKLIAVVNRMDRVDITKDSCGEVRLIYRLSYQSKTSASTLPFFINVVQQYPKQASCAEFAKSWQTGDVRKELAKLSFKQLEIGFQSLRFTSGYMQDFGGQAMYLQRIFRKNGKTLQPVALENTPDVEALLKNQSLREEFAAYLKRPENLKALDEGTLNIDAKYLAQLAISWSTLGRAREVNRPFAQLFHAYPNLLSGLDLSKMTYVKSVDGFTERLNNLSCMGCHQSGGTAGFHMLGYADPAFSHSFNRQQLALSPHAMGEESRRIAWVNAVAAGLAPNHFRPHSTSPAADWSKPLPAFEKLSVGQLCISTADFANRAVCGDASGRAVECRKTVQGPHVILGECVLKAPAAGSVCWEGELNEDRRGFFAFTDKWKLSGSVLANKGAYSCVLPQSGAPLGRMSRRCTVAEENFAFDFSKGIPSEICASQGGQGFDMCAASGDSGACLETKVARSMLDTCSPARSCREDYICQQFPDYQKISKTNYVRRKNGQLINLSTPDRISGAAIAQARQLNVGFCVPTYFLFNMRLDGHPSPVTGQAPGAPKTDGSLPMRGYFQ